jgi:hypothetical protein
MITEGYASTLNGEASAIYSVDGRDGVKNHKYQWLPEFI